MENKVIYRVLVKYIDKLGRERRYSKEFTCENYARKYFQDKFNSCVRTSDFYLYRIYRKSTTTICEVLRNVFVG